MITEGKIKLRFIQFKVVVRKTRIAGKKSFSMTLRVEILSFVSYERKNIIIYGKNDKFTKHNTFNNVFCNRIFCYYRFLPNF